jgi:hypothetical protein
MMNTYGVVLFHTSSAALRAEKTLAKAGLVVKLIPTPRELSSDCGIALNFLWSQAEQIKVLLGAARVEIAGIHPLEEGRGIVPI